jgi:WD40 repeat protein
MVGVGFMPDKFNMSDVMISYSRRDKPFVQSLSNAIKKKGHETWVDWDDIPPTVDWWEEIKAGIEAAHTFVFIISPNSIISDVCYKEIEHAVSHNKRIIPVVYEDIVEPEHKAKMHAALSAYNWILFRQQDDKQQAFKTLLAAIATDFSHTRQHTRLLVLAGEWNSRNRPNSFLLRGEDLRQAEDWLALTAGKRPEPTELHRIYIHTSRKAATSFTRLIAGIATFVIIALLGITSFAILKAIDASNQAQIAQAALNEAQVANANADEARQTEVAARNNADSAATGAAEAATDEQNALYFQETAESGQQTAELAAENANNLQATAAAQESTALAQQATAVAGQQTAEAAQSTAAALQQTAETGLGQAEEQAQTAQAAAGTALADANAQATQAAQSQEDAADAQASANAAQQQANAAQQQANAANTQAANAQTQAAIAQASAAAAQTEAANALTQAANARASAVAAQTQAANAQTKAFIAQQTANAAQTEAAIMLQTADAAQTEAANAQTEAFIVQETAAFVGTQGAIAAQDLNISSLMVEAQNQLGSNRPLAIHLALLAMEQALSRGTPSPALETIFYNIIYSHGLRLRINTANVTVTALAFIPESNLIALGHDNNTISIWNVRTGSQVVPPFGTATANQAINSLSYSNASCDEDNGYLLLSGGDEQVLRVWDAQGNQVGEASASTGYSITSARYQPYPSDGCYIVSAHEYGYLTIWRWEWNSAISDWVFTPPQPVDAPYSRYVDALAFSPDGEFLLSIANSSLIKWNTDELLGGNPVPEVWRSQHLSLNSLDYGPKRSFDVEYIAVGAEGPDLEGTGSVHLWLAPNSEAERDVSILAHDETVLSVDFNPRGDRVVSVGADNLVRIWSVPYGRLEEELIMPFNGASLVAYSPDGQLIASNSPGGLMIWDVPSASEGQGIADAIAYTCAQLYVQPLSDAEKQQYSIYGVTEDYQCGSTSTASTFSISALDAPIIAAEVQATVMPTPPSTATPSLNPSPTAISLPMGYLSLELFYGNWQPIDTGYGFRVREGDSLLISSEVDLSSYFNPVLHFFSIRDNSVASALVQASVNGGADWQFLALVGSEDSIIDLSLYQGQTVRFQFAWLPQPETAETWQVQDVRIEEGMMPTASPTATWVFVTATPTLGDWSSPSPQATLEQTSPTETETAASIASPTALLPTETETPMPTITETATEDSSSFVPTATETANSP